MKLALFQAEIFSSSQALLLISGFLQPQSADRFH